MLNFEAHVEYATTEVFAYAFELDCKKYRKQCTNFWVKLC